jgi:hypothetical protein
MQSGVHFIGVEKTLEALTEFTAAAGWGLFQGKQPVVTGEGLNTLETWLDRFEESGTTAGFTVRLYDTSPPYVWGTPYLCSFNIKLTDTYSGMGISGYNNKLMERIEKLEKGDKEGSKDFGDVVMGWFENPEQLDIVAGVIRKLMGKETPQTMGAITDQLVPQSKDEQVNRLAKALDVLERRDPKLVNHLEQLAAMDDLTFNMVMTKLNAL